MADSNITKRALATSLKELMIEQPFDKINVAQICERCNMNRKSFSIISRTNMTLSIGFLIQNLSN